MTMTRNRLLGLSLLGCAALGLVATGCKDITNNVETAELAGFWVATKLRFADPKNLNNTVDALDLGFGFTLEVDGSGAYTRVLIPPADPPDSGSGTLIVENGKDITLNNSNGTVSTGEVFKEDDQISLLFDENQGVTVELGSGGDDVPVTLLLVMDKR